MLNSRSPFRDAVLSPARWWMRLLVALALLTPILGWFGHRTVLHVDIEWQVPNEGLGQLFYADDASGFSADRVISLTGLVKGNWQADHQKIVGKKPVRLLRFDPVAHPGNLLIRRVRVTGPGGESTWEGEALRDRAVQQLQYLGLRDGAAAFRATEGDPQFVFEVPPQVGKEPWAVRLWKLVQIGALVAIGWLVLEGLLWWARRNQALLHRVRQSLDHLGQRISDEKTITFTASSVTVLLVLAVMAVAFVGLKLHQSSIARWDGMYGTNKVERWIDLGSAKAIRSDEWNTQTPWVLNQVQRGMPLINSNIGGAESAFVASTPVLHPTLIMQPKYWGFLFLDIERGFSWVWAYKIFGLLGSFFLLFLFLSRGDTVVSAAGALWVWGSSFVQWWFSSNMPELLIGFAAGLLGALYLAQARRLGGMLFGASMFFYAVATLLLHVYPAFIIPLAYLGTFVLLAWLLRPGGLHAVYLQGRVRAGVVLLVLACTGCFVWVWANLAADTIGVMSNTIYPGRRYHLGGGMPLDRLFYGFFEALRNSEVGFPLPPSNASEASSFLLLFPVILIMAKPRDVWCGESRVLGGLLAYCLLVLVWMSLPLPGMVREGLAALGWSMTTSNRAEIGLGIGSIMVVTLLAAHLRSGRKVVIQHARSLVLLVALGLALAIWGLWLRRVDPEFFYLRRLAAGSAMTLLIVGALIYRSRWGFLAAIGLFVLPALSVNPLQSGLASVMYKPVLNQAVQLGSTEGDRWAVIGSFIFSQGLKARGLDVVTGTHYTPNLAWVRVLDPVQGASAVWNRYAHVTYESTPGIQAAEFVLVGTDQYTVRLDVCSEELAALGVNRLAYTGTVPLKDRRCLKSLGADIESSVEFFAVDR